MSRKAISVWNSSDMWFEPCSWRSFWPASASLPMAPKCWRTPCRTGSRIWKRLARLSAWMPNKRESQYHSRRDHCRHLLRRRLHGICRQMRIARRRLHLGVAEEFANHRQALAGAAQLGGRQEPLALLLPILPDVLPRVGAVRPEPPQLGEIEHLREDLQAAVGLVGDVPVLVVEASHFLAAHLSDRPVGEDGKDELLQAAPILPLRRGLEMYGDMFGIEAGGEIAHRHCVTAGIAPGQRIDTAAQRRQVMGGDRARLLGRDDIGVAQHHPPRPSAGAVPEHEALPLRRHHPDAEAGDVAGFRAVPPRGAALSSARVTRDRTEPSGISAQAGHRFR